MNHRRLAAALGLILVAGSPAAARPPEREVLAGAPAAGPEARYCLRVEPATGSLIERVLCWTRRQWSDQGVDVDREWAREGVRVIA
ncbi:MAG: hypothetical protein JOZ90_02380 [Alphaproteobacteria bacterium]|nr:hypothetical protein [Alphaproteobacteria bacterium]MBV9371193.1 hypothetical protein [Alphaproteobacteria bacterium]MBV9899923.1 hypothetical protein [Alphaproteobacteria bacterium]